MTVKNIQNGANYATTLNATQEFESFETTKSNLVSNVKIDTYKSSTKIAMLPAAWLAVEPIHIAYVAIAAYFATHKDEIAKALGNALSQIPFDSLAKSLYNVPQTYNRQMAQIYKKLLAIPGFAKDFPAIRKAMQSYVVRADTGEADKKPPTESDKKSTETNQQQPEAKPKKQRTPEEVAAQQARYEAAQAAKNANLTEENKERDAETAEENKKRRPTRAIDLNRDRSKRSSPDDLTDKTGKPHFPIY